MKLPLDQNLSPRLIRDLCIHYPDSAHVRDLGLADSDDALVWEYAKRHGQAIASKDGDFHQRSFALGHPPKIVWGCLGNCKTRDVLTLLVSRRAELEEFDAQLDASFLIVP